MPRIVTSITATVLALSSFLLMAMSSIQLLQEIYRNQRTDKVARQAIAENRRLWKAHLAADSALYYQLNHHH